MWPKTVFLARQPEEIARYICFTARSIQIGKFPSGGFVVLPYLVPGNPRAVHFPDFPYSKKFWATLKKHKNYSLTQDFPESAIDELTNHLKSYESSNLSENSESLTKNFYTHLPEFIRIGSEILDFKELLPKIAEIKILLTDLGTAGSFSKKQNSDGTWSLYVTARVDFPFQNLFKVLIQAFIIISQPGVLNDVGTVGWYQRNAILKYLTEHTPLKAFLSHKQQITNDEQLSSDNMKFLTKLGYPPTNALDIQKISSLLTPQEKLLFEALYNNRGVLVTFDQAGEIVWKNEIDEKFSLQALAKLVEGIRKKITAQGIHQEVITTLRRRGYLYLSQL